MKITAENIGEALFSLGLEYDAIKNIENIDTIWHQIREAYKRKAREFHPDKNPTPEAEEKFKEISNIFKELGDKYNSNQLEGLLHGLNPLPHHVHHTDQKPIIIALSDAMKNSLYAYYIARYGAIKKPEEERGHETIRRILTYLLDISAYDLEVNYYDDNTGYHIQSTKYQIIAVIQEFLIGITNYNVEKLKLNSYGYSITVETAEELVGKQPDGMVNPDALSLLVKNLLNLQNTSKIYSEYNRSSGQFEIWVCVDSTVDLSPLNNLFNPPVVIPQPVINSEPEQSIVTATNEISLDNKIQLAFVLDVTGSMDSMLSSAKKTFKEIGGSIKSSEMSVITYHDYADEGKELQSASGRSVRGRFVGRHEVTSGRPPLKISMEDDSSTSPDIEYPDRFSSSRIPIGINRYSDETNTPKLQEALNYPGKRENNHLPVFTDTVTVSNILDAVFAEGGEDTSEMLEAALAVATQLPWNKPVRTMYIATDAPPHNHYGKVSREDNYDDFDKIKNGQKKLKKDPALKHATSPEDWITQVIVLARKGVKINTMICTTSKEVNFLATFISTLTGGSAMTLTDNQWKKLPAIIQERAKLDLLEAESFTGALVKSHSENPKEKFQTGNEFYHAILQLLKQINLLELFSDTIPVEKIAKTVRDIYSGEIKKFLATEKPRNDISALPAMRDYIRQHIYVKRSITPIAPAISNDTIQIPFLKEGEDDFLMIEIADKVKETFITSNSIFKAPKPLALISMPEIIQKVIIAINDYLLNPSNANGKELGKKRANCILKILNSNVSEGMKALIIDAFISDKTGGFFCDKGRELPAAIKSNLSVREQRLVDGVSQAYADADDHKFSKVDTQNDILKLMNSDSSCLNVRQHVDENDLLPQTSISKGQNLS